MISDDEVKKLVEVWSDAVGKTPAMVRIINRKLSVSLADKLTSGRYKSKLSPVVIDILIDEIAKDNLDFEKK